MDDVTLINLFEAQVAYTPGSIALSFGDEAVTYQELNQRANQLAHTLRDRGVQPQTLVGIFLERSIDMVVALLAVFKAGCAYVPFDPATPQARLAYMLADAQIGLLLTQADLLARVPETAVPRLSLDTKHNQIATAPTTNPLLTNQPHSLAYVIYTSGTTGKPKGVLVAQRGLLNHALAMRDYYQLQPDDRVLQFASLSFDVAAEEIFPTLLAGATLVLRPESVTTSLSQFQRFLQQAHITAVNLPTTFWHEWVTELAYAPQELPVHLRLVVVGSEEALPAKLRQWQQLVGTRVRWCNAYGPTEATVTALIYEPQGLIAADAPTVPIGQPIANMQAYILDGQLQEVPMGTAGELYLGGVGLALGYLGQPQLTAEKFIPHPFAANATLYRTGDRARTRADGQIEFLGRVDDQVKIRGYRIELRAVETVLRQHPQVASAAVVAQKDGNGRSQLIAYIIPKTQPAPTAAALRHHLQSQLPAYMTPAAFVSLERFPLTASGKIDRQALLVPAAPQRQLDHDLVPPRTPLEQELVALWEELLDCTGLGITDDFFALGGHSLLLTQLASRLRRDHEAELLLTLFLQQPTIAHLAHLLETAPASPTSLPSGELDIAPLTPNQHSLWYLDQLQPGVPLYNIPLVFEITGDLDTHRLRHCLSQIVQRHHVMRSAFREVDGQIVQQVAPVTAVPFQAVDLRTTPAGQRDQLAAEQMAEEARRPFTLSTPPLLRTLLLQMTDTRYRLLLTVHHIVFDGWSVDVFLQELNWLYANYPEQQPALPVQVANFAHWRVQLDDDATAAHYDYWQQQLTPLPPPLDLPTDYPRPAAPSYQGRRVRHPLNADWLADLQRVSQEQEATLFMTLLTTWQALLVRYTGQTDITVGTPLANRTWPGTAELIGFFVNTLPLRVNLAGNPTFSQMLAQTRTQTLAAYAHQSLPLEAVLPTLNLPPDRQPNALFQAAFVLQNAPARPMALPGLAIQFREELGTGTAKFDVTLIVELTDTGLDLIVEYSTDLFAETTVERLLHHYETLLHAVITNADQRLHELPLVVDTERRQLLHTWNETAVSTSPWFVHERVNKIAATYPGKTAVSAPSHSLTYQQLNQQANQLAQHLHRLGAQPETVIAVALPRSPALLVAMLAVLKTGAAYLPLDPDYPADRLAYMVTDSQSPILLTHSGQLATDFCSPHCQVVCLDAEQATLAAYPTESPTVTLTPQNLAYIIYTSGSTGKPKGVAVPHHGLSNLVSWYHHSYRLTADDHTTVFASPAFDASAWETWSALTRGATIHVPPNTAFEPEKLIDWLAQEGVTETFLPTALAESVLNHSWPADHPLRLLTTGGDALRQYPAANAPFTLVNNYGPTENSVISTSTPVAASATAAAPSIGRPIDNVQVVVLDAYGQLVPPNVPGELYLGGAGLARGYLHQPGLTAVSFVPNPFSQQPGARLYRTGDRVRYLADGTLEFLGRLDNQVKLRGFRIELGEIETLLRQHEAVATAVVTLYEPTADLQQLVAYLVLQADTAVAADDLRHYLQAQLPAYMVPTHFVILDRLPLTTNGKIDRRALPVPERHLSNAETIVQPRTPTEAALCAFWANILHVSQVGIHENFFALGGHSLLATQVIAWVRNQFGTELTLRHFLDAPTIAALAQHIDAQQTNPAPAGLIPIAATDAPDSPVALSFAQQRLWFLDQMEPGSTVYNMPAAFRLVGPLDQEALQQSLAQLMARHASLRTQFVQHGDQPMQLVQPDVTVPFTLVDLSGIAVAERETRLREVVNEVAERPFDLSHGPLFQVTLIQTADREHVLLLNCHHIISDGWSLSVLARDLGQLYAMQVANQPAALPPLPLQYADYARWQRTWPDGETWPQQMAYWRNQLQGDLPTLDIPTDFPWSATPDPTGASQTLTLSADLTQALQALSQQAGGTLFMTLLAAFKLLLFRLSGQEDLIVGTPVAGRNYEELTGLIGLFLNTLAIRTDLSGTPGFGELLQRVREGVLDAYQHQDIPFEKLVEELQPPRSLSRNPIFDVLFNFVSTPPVALTMPGLTTESFPQADPPSKFAMTLYVYQEAQLLRLELVYRRDLFTPARMAALLDQYQHLLAQIVAAPEQPITRYSLVTQRAQTILPDPRHALSQPVYAPVTEMFRVRVQQQPDATALEQQGQQWSYQSLYNQAQTMAHHLNEQGIGQGDVVAVSGRRSFGLVAGMLAVFYSGAVLLTLDPNLPPARQQVMLDEANAQARLRVDDTNPTAIQLELFPTSGNRRTLPDAAYLFFTSGTTGKPKGVLGTHQGLAHFLQWQQATFAIGPTDRCAQLTALSFDVVLRDIFTPLTSGATLCLPEADASDPHHLLPWLQQEKITLLHTVPTLADLWLNHRPENLTLPHLRLAFFAGEPLPQALVQRWQQQLAPHGQIVNLYGPTETTLAKCYYPVPAPPLPGVQPVGRPMPHAQALLLNSDDQLCGIGEVGEIVLRTPFRSLGYLNNPEETAVRFIINPFTAVADDWLYRTGDRGRYRPDGLLEILGRVDHQIKIRGMRIEPGEIAVVLQEHTAVQTALIVPWDNEGEKQLAAYLVAPSADATLPTDLRQFASERLPTHMVPTAYTVLEALPMNANGKVNRQALPPPVVAASALTYAPPQTPFEEIMVTIWQEVLGQAQVGIHNNFFDLGGHSLLATQIISRVRDQFEVDLPVRALFEHATIAALSARVEAIIMEELAELDDEAVENLLQE
ncbi:MAG: amino acid adenylation domain-containing protein [Ardenticatenaceae bacterium]|nr:amino acid adenylation domain-containing protein [Ardenticatenaceae bacterium]